MEDSAGTSTAATVSITVTSSNAPIAISRTVASVRVSSSNNPITLTGSDPRSETLSFALVSEDTEEEGTVTQGIAGSPDVVYITPLSFEGSDSFTFTVTNTSGITSSQGTITIPVVAADDPIALDQTAYTYIGVPIGINLFGTDPDGTQIVFSLDTLPSFGTIQSVTASGNDSAVATYVPNAKYAGSDSFTFYVSSGGSDSTLATVTITITDLNLPAYVDTMVSKYYQLLTEQ